MLCCLEIIGGAQGMRPGGAEVSFLVLRLQEGEKATSTDCSLMGKPCYFHLPVAHRFIAIQAEKR